MAAASLSFGVMLCLAKWTIRTLQLCYIAIWPLADCQIFVNGNRVDSRHVGLNVTAVEPFSAIRPAPVNYSVLAGSSHTFPLPSAVLRFVAPRQIETDNRDIPRNNETEIPAEKSNQWQKSKPAIEAIVPAAHEISKRTCHLAASNADRVAGMMRKQNTTITPAKRTANVITMPHSA